MSLLDLPDLLPNAPWWAIWLLVFLLVVTMCVTRIAKAFLPPPPRTGASGGATSGTAATGERRPWHGGARRETQYRGRWQPVVAPLVEGLITAETGPYRDHGFRF
ncbi:hypothetical protein [Streptomyces flavofungini]|uniref:Uncharacterized protein n=1 Tax=Streptomyces flavofungini TaxID=68200 RepID=A0ABS0WXA6_9ACTN|nr:hypothetical protein [Streptomyces flavofungini]MBJ3805563.1 hypothetical protein [Streptomyces flavofungini]GHC73162.1 hypothetical protein GCM10010349_50660 [Streptomyces flavofungini]